MEELNLARPGDTEPEVVAIDPLRRALLHRHGKLTMEIHERQLTWMTSFSHGIIADIGYFLYGSVAFPADFMADRIGSKRLLTLGIGSLATATGGYVADRFSVGRFFHLVKSGLGVAALVAAVGVWLLRRWISRFNWMLVREG
jgi:MFS family permease